VTGTNGIPFLDLMTPHAELKEELCEVFKTALETAGFIGGPLVQGFEQDFAAYCDAPHCVGVGNGTDALRFALIAAGIQSGDAVVTVPNTFIATTEAISQAGARPVFVDIDERTYNLDPAKLREYIERDCRVETGKLVDLKTGLRVAAIVPVHLYGQMADMDAILEIAEQHNLIVVEDACQAHGAEYFSKKENRWRKAGSMGKAAAFSFYPGKNLGACGEAGAVTTHDADLAKKIRMLRDHGQSQKYYHEMEGYNGRLDSIQAGILRIKLKHLTEWNLRRRKNAEYYDRVLAPLAKDVTIPAVAPWAKSVYHLYVVRVADRVKFQEHLAKVNIGTGIHYPVPLHLQTAYDNLGYKQGQFPVCELVASQIVSLPMFPGLLPDQQDAVADAMRELFRTNQSATATLPLPESSHSSRT
jgi:dTDP-4-amino-4,6-dideoxygalactose transaminase